MTAARSPGVWRHDWITEKTDAGEFIDNRRPQGLIMSEALTRCPAEDEAERGALIEAFTHIERGALAGARHGMQPKEEEE